MAKEKVRHIYRDARSGKIVTKKYADAHPSTTVRETITNEKATE